MTAYWDHMPGVPAAGHVTRGGSWHPGAGRNCRKQPCKRENARSQPHHFEQDPAMRVSACRECREPESFYRHTKERGTK